MTIATSRLEAGFSNITLDSQSIFRQCLEAMARPGHVLDAMDLMRPVGPLQPGTAAILLALADFETPVWLDEMARSTPDVSAFLRFHTGAPICDRPEDADFAVVLDPNRMPELARFKQGTADYPDRSTAVLIQVGTILSRGPIFKGPGISDQISIWASPLPRNFDQQLVINRRQFPRGVDLFFVASNQMAALPRSAAISPDRGSECTSP